MEVKAHARHLRMSSRKVRLVVDAVRGMPVEPALAQLTFMSRAAARPVKKLLESCIANAEHNFQLDREGLFIKAALVNQGPTLKRWRPRAMGSAAPILKRTCHITLVLESKTGAKKAEKTKAKKEEAHDHSHDGHDHEGHDHDHGAKKKAAAPAKKAAKKADEKKK
jgi:large subunit ribosomal protein L22